MHGDAVESGGYTGIMLVLDACVEHAYTRRESTVAASAAAAAASTGAPAANAANAVFGVLAAAAAAANAANAAAVCDPEDAVLACTLGCGLAGGLAFAGGSAAAFRVFRNFVSPGRGSTNG